MKLHIFACCIYYDMIIYIIYMYIRIQGQSQDSVGGVLRWEPIEPQSQRHDYEGCALDCNSLGTV